MERSSLNNEMLRMIADYMEGGFLDNIIAMFKYDKDLYPLIGDMLEDERGRVRLGTVALVEDLAATDPAHIHTAIPGIGRLLMSPNPTIRGDAAYLLGIIGHDDALPYLNQARNDQNEMVKDIVHESITIIKDSSPQPGSL